ncbi:MAG: fumarylacetoacetate hydrolase family protein [Alphaproteobacteria bacterium]|nr:fumarylacetoacetate hydrolase family protein [Alphaproteobacteria bacterium]
MKADAIDHAATIIADNRTDGTRLDTLDADIRPADLHDAYAVQERLNEILSARGLGARAGYKIGCTTPVMQEYMNIHEPAFGEVFASAVHRNHAELSFDDYVEPGVEAEIAVSLARDIPANGAPYDRESVREFIAAAMISIELVDARYRDYRDLDTPTMAADNFFNAAVVLGDPVEDWQGIDLAGAEASIRLNGDALGTGHGSLIMGHPLEALAWLANRLAERGRHLRAGEFVTLGSVIATHWVSKGDRIDHEIPGLGAVSITLA